MAVSTLPYIAVPESFKLPPGANIRGPSGVAFNSKGNIFIIHRGPMPLMEFDVDGDFIGGFGDGLFERAHETPLAASVRAITDDARPPGRRWYRMRRKAMGETRP